MLRQLLFNAISLFQRNLSSMLSISFILFFRDNFAMRVIIQNDCLCALETLLKSSTNLEMFYCKGGVYVTPK